MAEIFSDGFEGYTSNADMEAEGWSLFGTMSFETSDPYDGGTSLSIDANERALHTFTGNSTVWVQFYFRYEHDHTTEFGICRFQNAGSNDLQLRLATDGTMHLEIATAAQVGGSTAATSRDTWYKVGLVITHNDSISLGDVQIWLDDNLEVNVPATTDCAFWGTGNTTGIEFQTTNGVGENHQFDLLTVDDAGFPAGATKDSNAWLSRNRRDRPAARQHYHNPYGLKVLRALGVPAHLRNNLLRLPLGQRKARIRELVKRMRGYPYGTRLFDLG